MSDTLPPGGRGEGEPEPKRRGVVCEFCECSLTADGEIKRLSNRAKSYRDQEDEIARLSRELAAAQADLKTADETIQAWKNNADKMADQTGAGARRGFLFDSH